MTLKECIEQIANGAVPEECVVSSFSWLEFWQSFFVIASSIAVIATAIFAWRQLSHMRVQIVSGKEGVVAQIGTSQQNSRLTATMNLLTQIQTNPTWRQNRLTFVQIRDGKKIREHANTDTEEAQCVRQQLNQYELIALGISLGIIDKDMYKRYYRTTLIKDWTECYPFIEEERKEAASYWVEMEALVQEFKV